MEVTIASRGGVSSDSPLGSALLGAAVGDVVEVTAPRGAWRATVGRSVASGQGRPARGTATDERDALATAWTARARASPIAVPPYPVVCVPMAPSERPTRSRSVVGEARTLTSPETRSARRAACRARDRGMRVLQPSRRRDATASRPGTPSTGTCRRPGSPLRARSVRVASAGDARSRSRARRARARAARRAGGAPDPLAGRDRAEHVEIGEEDRVAGAAALDAARRRRPRSGRGAAWRGARVARGSSVPPT